jgi:D-3-phosphoglycerate dehydrogenase
MAVPFRVGVTRNLALPAPAPALAAVGLDELAATPGVAVEFLPTFEPVLPAEYVRGYDALIVEWTAVTRATLAGADRLLLVARFGAGYDSIDLAACTERGILVTNAPDGTMRPMAVVNLTLLLAVTTRLVERDRLTRAGRWEDGAAPLGMGLTGRTLGLVGLGHIGGELLALARPLGMRYLVHDPYAPPERIAAAGAESADLATLCAEADVVCIACALTPETRGLIGAAQLARMKPTAFLVNAARGPIVDGRALTAALTARRLAGAALDVFDPEPPAPDDPLLGLDNVVLSPHALANTDECLRLTGLSAGRSVQAVLAGRAPRYVVNRAALEHPRLQARLAPAGG